MLVRKAIYQVETVNTGSQCEIQQHVIFKEKIVEVVKEVPVPSVIVNEVIRNVEVPVYTDKIVEVEVDKIVI